MEFKQWLLLWVVGLGAGVPVRPGGHRALRRLVVGEEEVFAGSWTGSGEVQASFLHATQGKFFLYFDFGSELTESESLVFQLSRSEHFDEPLLILATNITVREAGSLVLETLVRIEALLQDNMYDLRRKIVCDALLFAVFDRSRGRRGAIAAGRLSSPSCGVEFSFAAAPKEVPALLHTLFFLAAVAGVVLSAAPHYAVLTAAEDGLDSISDATLVINSLVDLLHVVVTMSFSLRVVFDTFQTFSLVSFALMIAMMTKVRLALMVFERKLETGQVPAEQAKRQRMLYLLKFAVGSAAALLLSARIVVNYEWNHLLFAYPLLQIVHNACFVTRKNCFKAWTHGCLFLPQALLPVLLRCFPAGVVPLRHDYGFSVLLTMQLLALLWAMKRQRDCGSFSALARLLRVDRFDYYHNCDPTAEPCNCPICFTDVNANFGEESAKKVSPMHMRTPCGHAFHVYCLETWMEHKLVCPCCRYALPPY